MLKLLQCVDTHVDIVVMLFPYKRVIRRKARKGSGSKYRIGAQKLNLPVIIKM